MKIPIGIAVLICMMLIVGCSSSGSPETTAEQRPTIRELLKAETEALFNTWFLENRANSQLSIEQQLYLRERAVGKVVDSHIEEFGNTIFSNMDELVASFARTHAEGIFSTEYITFQAEVEVVLEQGENPDYYIENTTPNIQPSLTFYERIEIYVDDFIKENNWSISEEDRQYLVGILPQRFISPSNETLRDRVDSHLFHLSPLFQLLPENSGEMANINALGTQFEVPNNPEIIRLFNELAEIVIEENVFRNMVDATLELPVDHLIDILEELLVTYERMMTPQSESEYDRP